MSGNQEQLAVLFADISGSSDIYERLGDERGRRAIAQCVANMTKNLAAFQGALIKVTSDEVMCTFPSAELAFHAACAMQDALENNRYIDGEPMHIRIGFHYGEVARESGDVFGDTVNLAARVAAKTRANQILVTQAVVAALPPALGAKTRRIERAELKDQQAQYQIYMVIWSSEEKMNARVGSAAQRKS